MKAIIVEDEPLAAERLCELIQECDPDIEILSILDTVRGTVAWLEQHPPPDVIFLDIHLADGSGFDIFSQVKVETPIIFTTAYDEYAIRAFKLNSLDYLLKPVKKEELAGSLEKYRTFFRTRTQPPLPEELESLAEMILNRTKDYKSRFLIKSGNLIKAIQTKDIAFFYSEEGLSFLMDRQGYRYPINFSLDELEEQLDPSTFMRVNRKYITHIDSIKEIHPYFKGRLKVLLTPGMEEDIILSADRSRRFKDWLDC